MALRWTVCFLALLLAFPLAAQEELGGGTKHIDIEWATSSTEHFDINYEAVISAQTVTDIGVQLEQILEQYVAIFKFEPDERLVVKFMESPNTYQQMGGDRSHPGMYIERPGEKYLLIQQMAFYQLVPTVYHEAFHQYLAAYMEGTRVPTWFNEGMAMYYEGMQRDEESGRLDPSNIERRKLRMVKDAVFTRQHLPLAQLIDASYEEFHERENESLHYNQSFAFIDFLMQLKPNGKLVLDYVKELKKTQDSEEALEKLLGKKRKKLEKIEEGLTKYLLAYDEED